jgi:transglutaminase-like putative cysteine protease
MVELGLVAALMAATSWAALAAGWTQGDGNAVAIAGVLAVAAAAILGSIHAHRILAALVTPFVVVVAVVPATLAVLPSVPRETLGAVGLHYLRAMVTGLGSTQGWDFIVGLSVVVCLSGYWLGWMALREHRGVLAVVPVYSLLAVTVLNAQRPDGLALPLALAMGLSLAVIAAAHLGSLRASWAPAGISALKGLRWRFVGSAAPVAAGLTIVALVLPAVSSTDFSARLFAAGGSGAFDQDGGGAGSNGTSAIGFSLSVKLGGSLVNAPKIVLTYRTDSGSGAYLQVATDTDFDRGNWYAPARGASSTGGTTWGSVPFASGPLPRDTSIADGGIGNDEQAVDAQVVVYQGATGDQQLVPFTGEPDAVDFSGTAFGTISASEQERLLTVDSVQLDADSGATLQTVSLVSTATAAQLSAAGTNYPAWTRQYTELDDDGTRGVETIRSLATQWTAGRTDPYDEAIAIETHLRNRTLFQYTLDPPADSNPNVWPLVYFLTTSHRGYCQYFASAMGAMLRSLGIPTRLVNGYGPGTAADESGIRPQAELGEQIVTTSDAHTWVEAYFPHYGWIPFEPTPPSAQGDYEPFVRGSAAVAPAVTPASHSVPSPHTSKPAPLVPSGSGPSRSTAPVTLDVTLSVLSVAVGLVVLALLWFASPRSVTGAWRRVEALGVIIGLERTRAETHRAFALRLSRSRPRAGPAFNELAALTGRAEFSATGTSVSDRVLARRTWRRALVATLSRGTRRTAS